MFSGASVLDFFYYWWYLSHQTSSILLIIYFFYLSGGQYVYIETSSRAVGAKARLISPSVQPSAQGSKCLTFWYHMYGQHVDKLNVYVQYGLSLPSSATWSQQGTQGNTWKQEKLTVQANKVFNVSSIQANKVFNVSTIQANKVFNVSTVHINV